MKKSGTALAVPAVPSMPPLTVNTNLQIITTKMYRKSGLYNGLSIDFTSFNTNCG